MPLRHFCRYFFCLILSISAPAHAWNATGHREVVAVAWVMLDSTTQARIQSLVTSQNLIPNTQRVSPETAWMAASLWPDDLRDQADNTAAPDAAPTTTQQWLQRASSGHGTRRWHYVDRNIAQPFHRQSPDGLLELALGAQIRLLSDATLTRQDRAVALAWVSHLIADAHQPLHCASRALPGKPGSLDAGGNLTTVFDAGRKPPEPLSLHRWWDELPGHARPGSGRFDRDVERLHRQIEQMPSGDLAPLAWIEESFDIARTHVYPGLVPDKDDPGTFLVRQDYWLESREITTARLAQAGKRLAAIVSRALRDLP